MKLKYTYIDFFVVDLLGSNLDVVELKMCYLNDY